MGEATPLIDPRGGDAEDDRSSTKERSLIAIGSSMLVEISLPKLLFSALLSIVLPAILLGLAPLLLSAWLSTLRFAIVGIGGIGATLALAAALALAWFGWRPLYRLAEANFWSLNALAVQPGYALCREALRHIAESLMPGGDRGRLRAASAVASGLLACALALLVAYLAWPMTRWEGTASDLLAPNRLIVPTMANAATVVALFLAAAALGWGLADARMDQPQTLASFDAVPPGARTWRVAHLSDIHVVGEPYGFRIESGRAGPRGNERLARIFARLGEIDAERRLDLVLVTGDITDAGRSAEWAAFLDAAARHPSLLSRLLILPGNHDVNIIDRSDPAKLDLPFSMGARLRQLRMLSAMVELQGGRLRAFDSEGGGLGRTLSEAVEPFRARIEAFASAGSLRLSPALGRLYDDLYPLILAPEGGEGLGVAILDSNAKANFSFTNALGLVSAVQARRLARAFALYPDARWIVAIHHHLIEYPMPVKAFSERIGTALINGSWFVRKIAPYGARSVVMHGHRHIDWIGHCGALRIVSAPSPVMEARNSEPRYFYLHTLAAGPQGRLALAAPRRIEIPGTGSAS